MKKLVYIALLFTHCATFAQDSLSSIDLKEVVFTGQFEPQSLRQSVYQVRTISQETIQKRSATNVQSVLNTELGIRFSNDPALGTSDIKLMGMGGQNVKILLDGVPLMDRGATRESLNQVDVKTIERIEIVEGPMSVIYGSDALAGVINIITKKGLESGNSLSVRASVQEETAGKEYDFFSGKGLHNESVSADWRGGNWFASAGVTRNFFGGWRENRSPLIDSSFREWHPKDQWLGTGTIGFNNDKFNIWYRLNYLNENILSKEQEYLDSRKTRWATDREFITNRYTHQLQASYQLSDRWNFNGIASFQDYSRRTRATSLNLETGDRRLAINDEGGQDKSIFRNAVVRVTAVHKWSTQFSVQTGTDVNFNTAMGDRIDMTRSINDYALFASVEYTPSDRINIRPGLRFIYNSVYDAPPVVPSLNTKFTVSDNLDLRVSYAYGFRAPALRELYFSFHDSNHDLFGNQDLKAENSNSFTASLAWQAFQKKNSKLVSTFGTFYNQFNNMIDLLSMNDPGNSNAYKYVNIYKSKTTGFTLNNSLSMKNALAALGFSYLANYNDYSESDSSLPTLLWTPEVNASFTYYFENLGASASMFYKYSGVRPQYVQRTIDGQGVIQLGEISAYHWADITISKRMTKLLELNAGVKNLFDITQVNSTVTSGGTTHASGGAMPVGYGRSYFVSLNFHFVK